MCCMSPRQRVVRRGRRCMTMTLLKFNKACRCFVRAFSFSHARPAWGLFTSSMFERLCGRNVRFDVIVTLRRFHQQEESFGVLFKFVLGQWNVSILTDGSNYSVGRGLERSHAEMKHSDVKSLGSQTQESAAVGLLLLVFLRPRFHFKVVIYSLQIQAPGNYVKVSMTNVMTGWRECERVASVCCETSETCEWEALSRGAFISACVEIIPKNILQKIQVCSELLI